MKIILTSYDHKLIDESVKKIIELSKATKTKVNGPIPLPTKKEIFTILRSPHVNKSSREQFERRTHKRLIILEAPTAETNKELKRLIIPNSVQIQVKM